MNNKENTNLNAAETERFKDIKETRPLRVWCIINPPAYPHRHDVGSVVEAAEWIETEANKQLQNDEIWGNAFGLEVLEDDGEWCEWYSEDGDCIDDLLRDKK